ncbi:MAG: 2-isopropylmalate synthase [Christensenellaceae bacterium]
MTRQIKIFDTTLRDGEQAPGFSMNIEEKLRMARQLARLRVDIIEAGFAISSLGDFASVEQISAVVQDSAVASLARAVEGDIEAAAAATRQAAHSVVNIFLATSPLHMEYKLRMQPEEVLSRISQSVAYARNLCGTVEFSAEDATRSDPAFLAEAFSLAIAAGADVINIADTVGYITPEEMKALIAYLFENVQGIEKALLSVHCHNDLGMAVANTLAAIEAGAGQVDCAVNGIGERAGNAALEEVVMALKTREDKYGAYTNIDSTQLYRTSSRLSQILTLPIPPNKAIVGKNAFAHEAGIHQHGVQQNRETYEIMTPASVGFVENKIVFGKHSGKHALFERLFELGFRIPASMQEDIFERFKRLADQKKEITDYDLEALAESVSHTKEVYTLTDYRIFSSNIEESLAEVSLSANGKTLYARASASGPVLAAYQAIDKISPIAMHLDDYRIRSITEGQDAQGQVSVKVSAGEHTVSGSGLSVDILESSVLAYINALNKLLGMKELS